MGYVMTVQQLLDRLEQMVNSNTIYVKGGFGAVANASNKSRYATNDPKRADSINNASSDTFFFDCAGMIKGAGWGWCGDTKKTYGGAVYKSNGIPDKNENMIEDCIDVSTDMSNIEVGEMLYTTKPNGHCAIYIGNGRMIESTPSGSNGVQISDLARVPWMKHGKLPWVDYGAKEVVPTPSKGAYNEDAFRFDVFTILGVSNAKDALEKTITISTCRNMNDALVTPLERYFKAIGIYTGDVEADKGKIPCFGRKMLLATKVYQRNYVKASEKNIDGIITAKQATWKKLLGL